METSRTVNSAITRRSSTNDHNNKHLFLEEDLYIQIRSQKPRRLIVFTVDTSDSMGDGPTGRMSAALGAIVSLASKAYLNRDLVCLVTFRDNDATLVVPPTNSVTLIRSKLSQVPIGGATPLAAGLTRAHQVILQETKKDSALEPLLVLISDGIATKALTPGAEPKEEALSLAQRLGKEGIAAILIDTLAAGKHKGAMSQLAKAFKCSCHHIHNLQAKQVLELIKES